MYGKARTKKTLIKKLTFDKETCKVYCENTEGERYAEFPCSFNYWDGYNDRGERRTPIANGTYPITNEDENAMEYGHFVGAAYGTFWVALDTVRDRGWHGYEQGTRRNIDSGTYGCIRSENEDGEEVCRAIEKAIENGIEVTAEVVGDVDEYEKFCVGYDGQQ